MPKVLIPIGDAAEAMDTLYPYFRVREDGFEAVVAGPEKRVYPLVMHEIPPGWDITRESASYPPGGGYRIPRCRSRAISRTLSNGRTGARIPALQPGPDPHRQAFLRNTEAGRGGLSWRRNRRRGGRDSRPPHGHGAQVPV